MDLLIYSNYETYIYLADRQDIKDIKYYMKSIEKYPVLEVRNVSESDVTKFSDPHSIGDMIGYASYAFYESKDFLDPEKLKRVIVRLCKKYGIKEFMFDNVNIIK